MFIWNISPSEKQKKAGLKLFFKSPFIYKCPNLAFICALPRSFRKWRRLRHSHGTHSTIFIYMSTQESPSLRHSTGTKSVEASAYLFLSVLGVISGNAVSGHLKNKERFRVSCFFFSFLFFSELTHLKL